jgi:hypothetical protein
MANQPSLPLSSDGITPNPAHQVCKKTQARTHKSGNREYFQNPESPYRSKAWVFFTDDEGRWPKMAWRPGKAHCLARRQRCALVGDLALAGIALGASRQPV